MSKGAAASETCFGTGQNQPVVLFSPNFFPSLHLPIHHISVQQTVFLHCEVYSESKRDSRQARGRCLGYVATRKAEKRVAVYYQLPGDAERIRAQPLVRGPASHTASCAFVRVWGRHAMSPPQRRPGGSLCAGPQGIS